MSLKAEIDVMVSLTMSQTRKGEWSLRPDHYDIVEPNQHHTSVLLHRYSLTILAFKGSSCLEFHLPELTF